MSARQRQRLTAHVDGAPVMIRPDEQVDVDVSAAVQQLPRPFGDVRPTHTGGCHALLARIEDQRGADSLDQCWRRTRHVRLEETPGTFEYPVRRLDKVGSRQRITDIAEPGMVL